MIGAVDMHDCLPLLSFSRREDLRAWHTAHGTCLGFRARLFKKKSGTASITFEDLLVEGLYFGWSESLRHAGHN